MDIPTYLDHLRNSFSSLGEEEREAVLIEIRDHLDQESERLRNLSPGMAKEPAVAQALDEFGAPEDIAVVYDGRREEMDVINQRTGERLLDLPTAQGEMQGLRLSTSARALRVIIKYRGATMLAILGLVGVFLAAGLFFGEEVPDTQGDVDTPLYQYDQQWTGEGDVEPTGLNETFVVDEEVSGFQVRMDIQADSGCVRVEVIDPSGSTRADSGAVCDGAAVAPETELSGPGTWSVRYTYTSFTGSVQVDVHTVD